MRRLFESVIKKEKGLTFVEVIIALALLSVVAVTFVSGMLTASKAVALADEQATAESLARSQMESAKTDPYIDAPLNGEVTYGPIDISEGYSIWSVGRSGEEEGTIAIPWDSNSDTALSTDLGRQKISLIIKHYGKTVFTLEDYKVKR